MGASKSDVSWDPVRNGRTYCAPACGGGCTWAKYQRAHKEAKALANLLGEGWVPEVWENMGWFYKAVSPCGRLKVHGHHYDWPIENPWTAFLGEVTSVGGRWVTSGPTPQEALREVIARADADLAKIQASIQGLDQWRAG